MAKLINDRGYVHHFNIASQNIRSTRIFLENACAQLIARYELSHQEIPPRAFEDIGFLAQCLEEEAATLQNHPVVLAIDAVYEPMVCILGVAQEPVTVQQIANWTSLEQGQVKESLRIWREFLEEGQVDGERSYRIYHASFQDFLKDQVDLVKYDGLIADYYLALAGSV